MRKKKLQPEEQKVRRRGESRVGVTGFVASYFLNHERIRKRREERTEKRKRGA